jgi:hypothetical protein
MQDERGSAIVAQIALAFAELTFVDNDVGDAKPPWFPRVGILLSLYDDGGAK